jgi:hypothetical protein
MDETRQRAQEDEARPDPRAEARARAKAYLDLWERHLVRSAVDGPVPRWIPSRP